MTRYVPLALMAVALLTADALAQRGFPGTIDLKAAPQTEAEMLKVLRSDAPGAEKAAACKLLAIYGSSEAVPELARLLSDPQLASWARISLEAIPGPECDKALRDATQSLDGELLVGVINSIGVRRDAGAVDVLVPRLQDTNADVAAASAVALGRTGEVAAIKSLRPALAATDAKVRSAVAEGLILCAEQRIASGDALTAVACYENILAADVPDQRKLEATRGTILARGEQGIPLLIEMLDSPDKNMFQMALGAAREFPGNKLDNELAVALRDAQPERGGLIVQAMADRTETVDVQAVLKAAEQGHPAVRAAAVAALARVGNAECLSTLIDVALNSDDELASIAKQTLADIPGDDVDARLLDRLATADGPKFALLIEVAGMRRIDATPLLLQAIESSDEQLRTAALTAIGETISLDQLPVLVSHVVNPRDPEDGEIARAALRAASIRMPDREACATKLAAAIEQSDSADTKVALLDILGEMGGKTALAAVAAAGNSENADLQDAATRLLGPWMTADAAPVLLDLANTLPDGKYQVRALRGYIRIARQFTLPEKERSKMCNLAFDASNRADEQRMVLQVLERYPNAENLELAAKAMKTPELRDEATKVHRAIADKINK